jgi:hypothetical protein
MKAFENVYFSDSCKLPQVEDSYHRVKQERPYLSYRVRYLIPNGFDELGNERWRVAEDANERALSSKGLIMYESNPLDPASWPRFFKIRMNVRYTDTNTAAGLLRRDKRHLDFLNRDRQR